MKGMKKMKGIFLSFLWFLFIPQFIGTANNAMKIFMSIPAQQFELLFLWLSIRQGHAQIYACIFLTKNTPVLYSYFEVEVIPHTTYS